MESSRELKDLCLALVHADTEAEVINLLRDEGYWDNPDQWRWFGDQELNYSSVGNQQSRAEHAFIEKLINSIDTKLVAAARIAGCLPKAGDNPQAPDTPVTINEARERFFSDELRDLETLSRGITVAATGVKPREGNGRPCFSITDDGEGQTPSVVCDTILSLHKGNKEKIKFVQGKFNMGGTGVLEFCGMDRNLQLVVSKRNPALLSDPLDDVRDTDWSFTIVRREDPTDGKSSRFTYLAPVNAQNCPREGSLLNFPAESLAIFPEKNKPYARHTQWGTLIKLYEYDARRFSTNMMREDGLMYRARLLLPEPALPIRFHECRAYRGDPSRSFDTTMVGLIETLQRDLDNPKRDSVEWFDKLEFDVDGEKITARIYLFKNRKAADAYRRDEGLIFTYNGQCHAVMTKDFFRRKKVKQDYLWHSLLVFVDCSQVSRRAFEKLFMNRRDGLRDGILKAMLEAELEDQLGRHEELKELASERRRRELAEQPKTSESMAKLIENLLNKNPALAALLGQGMRIKNPHKPLVAGEGVAGFIGKRFPTKFYFKGHGLGFELTRDAHLNAHARITFETDAANDYFRRDEEPGEFTLYCRTDGKLEPASNYQRPRLYNGHAHLSLVLPSKTKEGDELWFEAHVTDPSRIEPFTNAFKLTVKAERPIVPRPPVPPQPPVTPTNEDDGYDKSPKGSGTRQTQDSFLDIPDPIPVYESNWSLHEFDRDTAMRIKQPPEAEEGEDRYDFYINMDNVHLQSALKARPKLAGGMKLRYSIGMTLVALALLHQEQLRSKRATSEDMPDERVDVRDRVAQVTCALAPFLLPMIESVSELDEDADYLSESAGEAA